ncbi:MAG: hypothetical protein JNL45_09270 [Hyphomicrobium sp.]|jgi:hypothetical protein|nr:hypothetical protein [Hyphomicrobium sp.]
MESVRKFPTTLDGRHVHLLFHEALPAAISSVGVAWYDLKKALTVALDDPNLPDADRISLKKHFEDCSEAGYEAREFHLQGLADDLTQMKKPTELVDGRLFVPTPTAFLRLTPGTVEKIGPYNDAMWRAVRICDALWEVHEDWTHGYQATAE